MPLKCCAHLSLVLDAALFWYPFQLWSVQVLCIVTAQGGGRCQTVCTVKIAVHSAKGCCTATTTAHTSIQQKIISVLIFKQLIYSLTFYTHSNIWSVKVIIPLGIPGVEYRYLVCRRFPAYHEDEDEDCYIIRHWEAGVKPRYKSLIGMTSILP